MCTAIYMSKTPHNIWKMLRFYPGCLFATFSSVLCTKNKYDGKVRDTDILSYCQALCLGKKQLGKGRERGKGGGGRACGQTSGGRFSALL